MEEVEGEWEFKEEKEWNKWSIKEELVYFSEG